MLKSSPPVADPSVKVYGTVKPFWTAPSRVTATVTVPSYSLAVASPTVNTAESSSIIVSVSLLSVVEILTSPGDGIAPVESTVNVAVPSVATTVSSPSVTKSSTTSTEAISLWSPGAKMTLASEVF